MGALRTNLKAFQMPHRTTRCSHSGAPRSIRIVHTLAMARYGTPTSIAGTPHWYNHEHRHSRIGLHTPASEHYGNAHDIRAARQTTLDAAWLAHPERFNRRPTPPRFPERVTTNDPANRTINPQPQKA